MHAASTSPPVMHHYNQTLVISTDMKVNEQGQLETCHFAEMHSFLLCVTLSYQTYTVIQMHCSFYVPSSMLILKCLHFPQVQHLKVVTVLYDKPHPEPIVHLHNS